MTCACLDNVRVSCIPCWHICWPDGHHQPTYANTLATVACLTTIAHITSIASIACLWYPLSLSSGPQAQQEMSRYYVTSFDIMQLTKTLIR